MIKQITFLLLSFFMLSTNVNAQRNCGTMEVLEEQLKNDPGLQERMEDIERFTEKFIRNNKNEKSIITIPVVVHVVWKTSAQQLSASQIQTQLDVLTEDFRRTNADQTNNWPEAADTEIQFCLASVDPSGNSTSGIQYRKTNKPSFQANDGMKHNSSGGLDAWPAADYLNMWSCNLAGGLLGYAQFPGGNPATDGVVVDYAYFGRGGSATAPFDLGRTATHEVGHWLNLRHIWGDGGCSVDDFVSDTPLSDAPNYGCATGHVSCSTLDMIENYMDYSDDGCMNLYTMKQGERMNALFGSGGARASLLNSPGCGGGGGPSCTDGVQNQDETGVDCGGTICAACPTCSDGIQNGNETGVDCGGSCGACPETCTDGILNQNETGIDCGGVCAACTCGDPTNLQHTRRKGGQEALLEWDAVTNATQYNIELDTDPGFSPPIASGSTTGTSITATGLTKNNLYYWRIMAICNSGSSSWVVSSFNARLASENGFSLSKGIKIYPNPAFDYLTVDMQELSENVSEINIVNSMGQLIKAETPNEDFLYNVDISNFEGGIYFLRVISTEGEVSTKKFFVIK